MLDMEYKSMGLCQVYLVSVQRTDVLLLSMRHSVKRRETGNNRHKNQMHLLMTEL